MLKKLWPWLLIFSFSFFSFKSLLRPGYFPMHDDMQAMRVLQMDKCLRDGQIPCRWVPDMGYGYGYPQFLYYSPLPYYLMEAIHLFGFSVLDSVKIGFALSFIASGFTMFLLARSFWGVWGGILAATFYIYAPYRASDVFTRGAVGEFWAMAFLPLIFWSVWGIIVEEKHRFKLFFALALAGLLTTHNITSIAFSPLVVLWGVFWLWRKKQWVKLPQLILGGLWGFCLAGFFIFPVILEKQYAHVETMIMGYFNYLAHFVSLRQLFFSGHWGYGSSELGSYDDLSFSLGFWHWFLALVTTILATLNLKKIKETRLILFLFILALATIFMTHQRSVFLWNNLPFLKYFQFPWRFLSPAIFLLSFLAGGIVIFFKSQKAKIFLGLGLIFLVILFNAFYFRPRLWYNISDSDKFKGELWEKQLTISIFDYLPIFAQAPPAQKAPSMPLVLEGNAQIDYFKKGSDWQKGKIVALTPAKICLPLFYFPGFTLYLNGHKSAIDYNNSLGLISFEVLPGDNTFFVKLKRTPVRAMGDCLTFLGILTIGYYFFYDRKNKKI